MTTLDMTLDLEILEKYEDEFRRISNYLYYKHHMLDMDTRDPNWELHSRVNMEEATKVWNSLQYWSRKLITTLEVE